MSSSVHDGWCCHYMVGWPPACGYLVCEPGLVCEMGLMVRVFFASLGVFGLGLDNS